MNSIKPSKRSGSHVPWSILTAGHPEGDVKPVLRDIKPSTKRHKASRKAEVKPDVKPDIKPDVKPPRSSRASPRELAVAR
jgi:hypothetical protein